jgi:hypothetical protein
MITTRKFSILKDLQDPRFRCELLSETAKCLMSGDLATGKIVLREYINGTIGFVALGEALGKSPKSLMRMLGPHGNPTASNLLDIIAHLQKVEGGHFEVQFISGADESIAA